MVKRLSRSDKRHIHDKKGIKASVLMTTGIIGINALVFKEIRTVIYVN